LRLEASCTMNIINGDYLDEVHQVKPVATVSVRLERKHLHKYGEFLNTCDLSQHETIKRRPDNKLMDISDLTP
jgi:hypothetical protein